VRRRFATFALGVLVVAAACGGTSPTPSGSVDGAKLAASFVAILGDPTLHADIVQQATASADQAGDPLDLRVTMSGVLALPDVDLALVVEAGGQSTRFRVVVVGDQSFADLGAGWVAAPPGSVDTTELSKAVVVVTDPNDLEYVGTTETAGRTLYHLATTGPLPYTPAGFAGNDTGTGTMNDMDAWVEADGTPVRIALSFTATGTTNAGTTTVNGTTEIRFSDVGGNQVVVAPSLAPSAVPSAGSSAAPSAASPSAPSAGPSAGPSVPTTAAPSAAP
jgi:hypothetical protein